jgi:hypothetical protein
MVMNGEEVIIRKWTDANGLKVGLHSKNSPGLIENITETLRIIRQPGHFYFRRIPRVDEANQRYRYCGALGNCQLCEKIVIHV